MGRSLGRLVDDKITATALRGKTFNGVITFSANGPSFPAHFNPNRLIVDDDDDDNDNVGKIKMSWMDEIDVFWPR
ncbi:unnamed protein product [Acanthocheilonema viteae]|uniref:Uncharacterized protein n=1 Tax=Acanthocheilonema viteae TaxID=6277 RepID=A0A498SJ09_ACAVI|nr:unnamed protein product [Acanthocheilonema viteae]